jgi:hypothetical protein
VLFYTLGIKVRVCVEMAVGARADKRIGVSVAKYDGFSTTYRDATENTVNGTHTVQAAVREAYPAFPTKCLRVKVKRNGEFEDRALWYPWDPDVVWRRELYDVIADGDEVVIVVSDYMPGGPSRAEEGVAARPPWDDGGGRSERAAGPLGARVVSHWDQAVRMRASRVPALLARLAALGAGAGSAAGPGTTATEPALARAWGLCTVWERKGKKTQVYTGGTGITSSAKRTSKTYKVKLTHGGFDGPMEDAEYDGQVQCIVESGVISEVEITGKGTMTYMSSQNVYTGCFENGLRHGEGTLTVQSKGRSLTTNWQQDLPAKTGALTFTGTTCSYEGEVRDFRMQGSGAFASTSPWFVFVGVFDNDVPVSGALTENHHLEPQPMTRIEPTSILSQMPKELDKATEAVYNAKLEKQRAEDRSKVKALDTSGRRKEDAWRGYTPEEM